MRVSDSSRGGGSATARILLTAMLGTSCAQATPSLLDASTRETNLSDIEVVVNKPQGSIDIRPHRRLGHDGDFNFVTSIAVRRGSTDTLILVTDLGYRPQVAVLQAATGKLIRRLPDRHSPGADFVDTRLAGFAGADQQDVWLWDSRTRRIARIARFATNPAATAIYQTRYVEQIRQPLWTGSGFVSTGYFLADALLYVDSTGRPKYRIRGAPPHAIAADRRTSRLGILNVATVATAPGSRRMAVAYNWDSRLLLFDSAAELRHIARGPRPIVMDYTVSGGTPVWGDNQEVAYTAVAVSETYIFALFDGKQVRAGGGARQVHVYDWSGRHLTELDLGHAVTSIALGASDSTLVGAVHTGTSQLAEWALPMKILAEAAGRAARGH